MPTKYNTIGKTYTSTRAADPRITSRLIELLGLPPHSSLIDIGAGTGNYSFALAECGHNVMAVEPSWVMREQAQAHQRLTWQEASAENLPFADKQFQGAVMTLCLHHMDDWQQGIKEALRVTGGGPLVAFAFDIHHKSNFWLFDYFPEFIDIDKNWAASLQELNDFVEQDLKGSFDCQRFPLPKDLIDHFAAAAWARPELYLQEKYRNGISSFSKINKEVLQQKLTHLKNELDSGEWKRKYGELLQQEFYDRGYVFLTIHS
ncbi:MAG: methyltransferase [SAR86 cluster bacterium]|uniref:Methyltransferase n=1 Tax=SAR86 cluster bacterium TaxID=2030880 RepID=A0A2A5BA86_9GAMM|nr:MAG: methyltransferase [SAR86 cluster bacterium]